MAISSNLTLKLLNQPFLLEKRIELLKAIKQTGSINKAAALVPMSYKTAWEAVEAMNNLSISPIVQKKQVELAVVEQHIQSMVKIF